MKNKILVISLCVIAGTAFADDKCQLNGQDVNLNNGSSTAGKTGTVTCKDSSGKVVRELEYANGKQVGKQMIINGMGEKVEKVVNEKGNSNGLEKHYDRKGTLISEGNFENGREQGMQKRYSMKGKLMSMSWAEKGQTKFHVSYDDSGKMSNLQCGDKSYTPEDKSLCGFDGKSSNVKLAQTTDKEVVYKNGKLQETSTYDAKGNLAQHEKVNGDAKEVTELFPDGKVKIKASYVKHALNGEENEFHASGKKIRTTVWDMGKMQSEITYYLNGSMKSRSSRSQKGKTWLLSRELFFDNGKPEDVGTYQEKTNSYRWEDFELDRWTYESPVGEHKSYYESGQLKDTMNYADDGQLVGTAKYYGPEGQLIRQEEYLAGVMRELKTWDATGKTVTKHEQYLEDGSRVNVK